MAKEDKKNTIAKIFLNSGIILYRKGRYEASIDKITRALDIYVAEKNVYEQANCYCNLAICYECMKEYDLALKYGTKEQYIRAEINDEEKEIQAMWVNIERLGRLFRFEEQVSRIEKYVHKCNSLSMSDDVRHGKKALKRASDCIKKDKDAKRLIDEIVTARRSGDYRAEYNLRETRTQLLMDIGMYEAAIEDLLTQQTVASRLNLPEDRKIRIFGRLAKSYSELSAHIETIDWAVLVLRSDCSKKDNYRLEMLQILSSATVGADEVCDGYSVDCILLPMKLILFFWQPYDRQVKVIEETITLASQLNNSEVQKSQLCLLKAIHEKNGNMELAKICDTRIHAVVSNLMPSQVLHHRNCQECFLC